MIRLIFLILIIIISTPFNIFAGTYFVRPEGGDYGKEDGSNYENAWNGLSNVIWGNNGLKAGDTLYICGTHIRTVTSRNYIEAQGNFIPEETGTRDNPIIIRGDYPGDPAIIWGAWKDERPGGVLPEDWKKTDVDGVWKCKISDSNRVYDYYGLYENINSLSYYKYERLKSKKAVENTPKSGVYYLERHGTDPYSIWLRPFNEDKFKESIRWSGVAGWEIGLGEDESYIHFIGLRIIAGSILFENPNSRAGPYHHYEFKNCVFDQQGGMYIFDPYNSHHITFDNCEFMHAGNGIYVIWNRGDNNNITVRNSYFHDIGQPWAGNPDGHAIGIQNNEYFTIENNLFERCGSAIDFHVGALRSQKHLVIYGNRINDMRANYSKNFVAPGYGIVLEGSNDCPLENQDDYLIAYNIVTNCEGNGISTSRKASVNIFNNVVKNCLNNFKIIGTRSDGASAKFYNNISLDPVKYHVYFNQNYGRSISYIFESDNNLYHPNNRFAFYHLDSRGASGGKCDFSGYKSAHRSNNITIGENSLLSDPAFDHTGDSAFELSQRSPCIDSGKDLGMLRDFLGQSVPNGKDLDIGAIEHNFNYVPPKNLRIVVEN